MSDDTIAAPLVIAPERAARARHPGLLASLPARVGLGIVLAWVVLAAAAPWIAPYPPNAQDYVAMGDPTPSAAHLLGTDILGRDILSRLLWGARVVLLLAPTAVAAAMAAGIAMGLLAGYGGRLLDMLVSRVSDIILSFPVIVLYVILIANVGPSRLNIVLAATIAYAPGIGRIVRGQVLELRTQDYVAAARLRGESALYIMLVELLPNCRGPLIVDGALRIGYTTVAIGSLGFIGLGLPPPDPDWGGMAKDGVAMITVWPHMALVPCFGIVSLVLGFNMLADGLKELADR